MFRNRRLVRALACFLLLETLVTLLAPGVSWAVSGPGQPEFTSYESPGSTDMVNLTTGDLTYNLPLLDVPGPERSFSLPLTYRAGIRLEQEASWVGLGWSINPGAIARSLNGYPDDVSREPYHTTFKKNLNRGWYAGIPGIINLGWDSETGHSGTAQLLGMSSVSWAGGRFKSVDLVGIQYTKGEGVGVDPVRMAIAAATVATAGAAAPLSIGANIAIQAGVGIATGVITNALGRKAGSGGFNRPTVRKDRGLLHTDYWVFYNDDTYENMYGSLYFRDMSKWLDTNSDGERRGPLIYKDVLYGAHYKARTFKYARYNASSGYQGTETAADLHQHVGKEDNTYYKTSMRPISIAHDDFSVMGGDVSGSIRPQLLEVGSLAMPRRMTAMHDKYNVVSYLDDYKIPFRYENSLSNGYDYHLYNPDANTDATGINHPNTTVPNSTERSLIIKDPRLMELYNASTRSAPTRKGIRNAPISGSSARTRGLDQSKHVEWYTNDDIKAGYPQDFQIANVAHDQNAFLLTLPGKGIGAFAITAEDGTTYHYSLPVYHLGTYSETREIVSASDPGIGTATMGQAGKVYATTWALTAITSSDYVDRGIPNLIDAADWGGWVKFGYGQFGHTYKWRQPYIGTSFQENDTKSAVYTEGAKETYYLNTIQTRTHTALFVKSVRNDARGHFSTATSKLGIDETTPASSLRLDEIVLLNNADYARLQTQDGIRNADDTGSAVPALTNNTAGNSSTWDAAELRSRDSYTYVLDGHDLDADSRIRAFVNARALKRVKFNFSYRLCPGTPSSFPSATAPPPMTEAGMAQGRTGKLTLESVSIFGPQSTKIVPDFKFTYGNNPSYSKDKWDGFGMYNRSGVAGPHTHQHAVSSNYQQASEDGAAWSLVEILDPLGAKTRLQYERDTYAHVSEFGAEKITFSNNNSNVLTAQLPAGSTVDQYLKTGDVLKLKGNVSYSSECIALIPDPRDDRTYLQDSVTHHCAVPYERNATVIGLDPSRNTVTIDSSPRDEGSCAPDPPHDQGFGVGWCSDEVAYAGASLTALLPVNRNGGNIRVAALTTQDENNNVYQTQYRYTYDQSPAKVSSTGVLSKEPNFVSRETRVFDSWYDYPSTPVLYGQVTVLRGTFKNGQDADHDQREVYSFHTPTSGMIIRNADFDGTGTYNYAPWGGTDRNLERIDNRSVINLGLIGQPASIRKYNRRGEQEFVTTFNYSNQVSNPDGIGGQGRFTEGVMTNEYLDDYVYRINRSTKEYLPTVMTSTTTIANGMRVDNYNDLYDFFTGQVLETHAKNSLGQEFITRTVPAYTLTPYAGMGLKSANSANHNMLTQSAADYVFKRGPGQTLSLVSAQVQTWNNSWTYRQYNASNDQYENTSAQKPVWRSQAAYIWNGARLNADGTYAGFVDFNWANPLPAGQNAGWLRTGEVTLYSPFSQALESRDLNGNYAASKSGNEHSVTTATSGNARYQEIAYSGAEDQLFPVEGSSSVVHFGGEVRDGARQTKDYAHAGSYSSQLTPGQAGFTYRAVAGSEVTVNRKYRLSGWVRGGVGNNTPTALAGAKLYASVDGNRIGEVSATAATTKKAGDWYLLNLYFALTTADAGKQLTVGCENANVNGVTAYFDDFRFQPLVSSMKAYNHDPHTGHVTHVLDNDNLYTRYQYDNAGKLIRVYKEALDRPGSDNTQSGKLVKEYAYNYARAAMFTVRATAVGTGQLTSSLDGGLVNSVEHGGEVRYTAVSTDCRSKFSLDQADAIKVDGVAITRDRTLSDGTHVGRLWNGCILSDVRGSHTVELKFTNYTVPPFNTRINEYCEVCETTKENTGYVIYQLADGCGGAQNNDAWHRELDTNFCGSNGGNRSAKRRKSTPTSTPALLPHCPDIPTEPSNIKTANKEQKASLRR